MRSKWRSTRPRHDHLAFTDADCQVGKNWLPSINDHFAENTKLVIGTSPYFKGSGLLGMFINYETFYAVFQYIGLALWGLPYMAVGRNIAYTREFYSQSRGFEAFKAKQSGDDDLFVNQFAQPAVTNVMLGSQSMVYSPQVQTWAAWFRQKLRHSSTAPSYTLRSKVLLILLHGSHDLFYFVLIGALIFGVPSPLGRCRFFSQDRHSCGLLSYVGAKWEKPAIIWLPLLDFLYFLYNLCLVPLGWIVKTSWK